jgi:hypothetical protein
MPVLRPSLFEPLDVAAHFAIAGRVPADVGVLDKDETPYLSLAVDA